MQAIAELALLQVADEAVEPGYRFGGSCRPGKAKIVFHTRSARFVADRGNQTLAPRRIETIGDRIFVEQLLKPHEILRYCACLERRRQMADCNGADPAL